MKQPSVTKPATTENQQNLDRYYWELSRGLPPSCLNQDSEYRHRILLRAMKQAGCLASIPFPVGMDPTDELRKKIRRLYQEHEN